MTSTDQTAQGSTFLERMRRERDLKVEQMMREAGVSMEKVSGIESKTNPPGSLRHEPISLRMQRVSSEAIQPASPSYTGKNYSSNQGVDSAHGDVFGGFDESSAAGRSLNVKNLGFGGGGDSGGVNINQVDFSSTASILNSIPAILGQAGYNFKGDISDIAVLGGGGYKVAKYPQERFYDNAKLRMKHKKLFEKMVRSKMTKKLNFSRQNTLSQFCAKLIFCPIFQQF